MCPISYVCLHPGQSYEIRMLDNRKGVDMIDLNGKYVKVNALFCSLKLCFLAHPKLFPFYLYKNSLVYRLLSKMWIDVMVCWRVPSFV